MSARILAIYNNTSEDLTYYRYVKPFWPWDDEFAVSYNTIHPGKYYIDYIQDEGASSPKVTSAGADSNNREYTRYLICRSRDVGAFFDIPDDAKSLDIKVHMDVSYSRISINANGITLSGDVYERQSLPAKTNNSLQDGGLRYDWNVADTTSMILFEGATTETSGIPKQPEESGLPDWAYPLIIGGAGLLVLLILVLLIRR